MYQYLYADTALEKALNLKFSQPAEKPFGEFEAKLHLMMDSISRELGAALGTENLRQLLPRAGFLQSPLKEKQKQLLNEALTLPYARKNIQQQRELQAVPVEEGEEPMARLRSVLKEKVQVEFSERTILDVCGPNWGGRNRVMYVRQSVARKILEVCTGLNAIDMQAHIEDCWRHREVQEGLFIRRIVELARQYEQEGWSWQDVKIAAMSFTASSPGLAGHMAGSAIDLRIKSLDSKEFLPLGNGYADGGAVSSLDFPYLTREEWETRILFMAVMRGAGLKLLRTENWHGSSGDRGLGLDGIVHMRTAIHGPLRDFDRRTGEVQPLEATNIDECFLGDAEIEDLVMNAREKTGNEHAYSVTELAEQVRRTHYQPPEE